MKYGVYLQQKGLHGYFWKPASRLFDTRAEATYWLKICKKSNPFGVYRIIEI